MAKALRLGDLLVESRAITEEELSIALEYAKEQSIKTGEALIIKEYITEQKMLEALGKQLRLKYINVDEYYIDKNVTSLIPESIVRKNKMLPINLKNGKVELLVNDPLDLVGIEDVKLITGFEVIVVLAEREQLEMLINKYFDGSEDIAKALEEFETDNIDFSEELDSELEDITNAPIVRLINNIFSNAVKKRVSDIHIEPFSNRIRVRFRVDGRLVENMTLSTNTLPPIMARLKIIGGMDISIRRKPQDGRVEITVEDKNIDMRISLLPTIYGEKAVIRLLDRGSVVVNKQDLGITDHNIERLDKLIRVPEGMLLVTGPTGSGKTTTLFTILKELNDDSDNIITVEDPVEYRVEGINQIQVANKEGLTFGAILRTVLRQDPDIIMIGEIRDKETAEIAIRASITGHKVLSTLHTNDAISTVIRLIDMGVEGYLVSSAIAGVVAQRLVRRLCTNCSVTKETTEEEMAILQITDKVQIRTSVGCKRCNSIGYKGRTSVHEILILDKELKFMINKGISSDAVKDAAIEKGMVTLYEGCKSLVLGGVTSIEELVRVAYTIE